MHAYFYPKPENTSNNIVILDFDLFFSDPPHPNFFFKWVGLGELQFLFFKSQISDTMFANII